MVPVNAYNKITLLVQQQEHVNGDTVSPEDNLLGWQAKFVLPTLLDSWISAIKEKRAVALLSLLVVLSLPLHCERKEAGRCFVGASRGLSSVATSRMLFVRYRSRGRQSIRQRLRQDH